MESLNDRVAGHAADASRMRTKSSILRIDNVGARNNKDSPYEDPSKLVPLLPPFMQIIRQKSSSVEKSFPRVSRETVDRDVTQHAYLRCAEKIVSLENSAAGSLYSNFEKGAASRRKNSSRSEKIAIRSNVSCEDTNVTSEAICDISQGSGSYKAGMCECVFVHVYVCVCAWMVYDYGEKETS